MPEEITKDTIILANSKYGRTVVIDGSFSHTSEFTHVHFTEDGATLTHYESDEKPVALHFPNNAMQALIDAYTQWQADMQQAAEAEQKRQEAVIATAKQIAKENPGIKIKQSDSDDGRPWRVSAPDAGFEYHYPAYTADELLEQVQEALQALQNHQKNLAIQQEALDKALELAKSIPGIDLNEQPYPRGFHKKQWHVTIPGIYESPKHVNAYNGEQLYEQVKSAYRAYSDIADKPVEETVEDAF